MAEGKGRVVDGMNDDLLASGWVYAGNITGLGWQMSTRVTKADPGERRCPRRNKDICLSSSSASEVVRFKDRERILEIETGKPDLVRIRHV